MIRFTKMHGTGNDYIYIDCTGERPSGNMSELARRMSDRHFGVGSDGLVLICPSETADFKMEMYNADGSPGLMCGNGIRCVAKYVYDRRMTSNTNITIETASGIRRLEILSKDGYAENVRVDMGCPIFDPKKIPALFEGDSVIEAPILIGGETMSVTCVSMGNPHAVFFVDDVKCFPLTLIGPKVENHQKFPERANAEFVEIVSPQRLKMRVWERGSGETLSCGTGACAVLVAAAACGKSERSANLELPGGELYIEWRDDGTVWMTGGAEFVFDGEYFDQNKGVHNGKG